MKKSNIQEKNEVKDMTTFGEDVTHPGGVFFFHFGKVEYKFY